MHKWDARDYQKNSEAQLKWGRELIAKLALKGQEDVLDIGCGDGKVTAEIARYVPQGNVVGIDNSQDMIDLAVNTFKSGIYPNLRFEQMDARNLSFDNQFDIVFSNAVLHWVSDHLSVLKGINRSLTRGGRILLQMGGRGNISGMLNVVNNLIHSKRWEKYFVGFVFPYSFYGPEEYKNWLSESGLKPVRVELIPKDMTHQGKEGVASWFRTTWHPFIHRIPSDIQQDFIEDAIGIYLEAHPIDAAGLAHIDAVRLEVEAIKG
jgi:trans-aconitate 2-methyltransferase